MKKNVFLGASYNKRLLVHIIGLTQLSPKVSIKVGFWPSASLLLPILVYININAKHIDVTFTCSISTAQTTTRRWSESNGQNPTLIETLGES